MRWSWSRTRHTARLLTGLLHARLRGRPLLLSHLVTCRCPCRCATCLWRGLVTEELSTAEIAQVYRDAAKCGILINSLWGGEPLAREDLPEILRASRQAGLVTVLITSGLGFTRRFDELVPWLDVVIFSLDHPSVRHDEQRGMPGLFEELNQAIGLLKARSPDTRVYLNSVISRLNQDAVIGLVRFAGNLGVPIYLHPIELGLLGRPGSDTAKQTLAVDAQTLSDICRRLIVLKGRGYPICNSYTYLRGFIGGKQPYRCHARKVCLELRPNGDLVDCLNRFRPVANVRDVSLRELLARPEIRRLRMKPVDCQVCNNANVIDTSNIWALRPESLLTSLCRHLLSR